MNLIDIITKAICRSGKFETGEGTCALICLDQLGNARRDCPHATEIHRKLAEQIENAIINRTRTQHSKELDEWLEKHPQHKGELK